MSCFLLGEGNAVFFEILFFTAFPGDKGFSIFFSRVRSTVTGSARIPVFAFK